MSQNEFHSGKLKKLDLEGKTLEEWCEAKCKEKEIEKRSWHDSWEEAMRDEGSEVYIIVDDEVYEVIDHYEADDDDPYFIRMTPQEDGTIAFVTQFYNGGTCFSECMEDGIKELKAGKMPS